MAVPLQLARRCLLSSRPPNSTFSRSAFVAVDDDPNKIPWIKISLNVIFTVAVWGLIYKDRTTHFAEYERRKALRESQSEL